MEKLLIQSQSSLGICLQWCGLRGPVCTQQSLLQNSAQILTRGLCRVAKGKASEVFQQTQSPVELCEVVSESTIQLRIGNAGDWTTFKVQRDGIEGILTTCVMPGFITWLPMASAEKGDDRGSCLGGWYRRCWLGGRREYGSRSADVPDVFLTSWISCVLGFSNDLISWSVISM